MAVGVMVGRLLVLLPMLGGILLNIVVPNLNQADSIRLRDVFLEYNYSVQMFWVLCRSTIHYSVLYLVFSECRFGVDNVLKEKNLKEHAASSLGVALTFHMASISSSSTIASVSHATHTKNSYC